MNADINTRPPSMCLMRFILALVFGFLCLAVLNHQSELTLLCVFIVGMVLAVKLWSRWSLKAITFTPVINTKAVFCGDAVSIAAEITNAKWLPVWAHIRIAVGAALRSDGGERFLSEDTWLLWHQHARLTYALTGRRRGVHHVGPFEIRAGDLLGFFSSGRTIAETRSIIVFPKLRPLKPIDLPRRDLFGAPGAAHPVEDPIYLLGTRDYQHQRPAKRIHWKASARLGKLQEKLCEPSAQERVLVLIDVMSFEQNDAVDAFERMIEVAASMAVQLHHRGIATGLAVNGAFTGDFPGVLPMGQNASHLSRLLEALARLTMTATRPMRDSLLDGIGTTAGVSCVFFSYDSNDDAAAVSDLLAMRRVPVTLILSRAPVESPSGPDAIPDHVHAIDDICMDVP